MNRARGLNGGVPASRHAISVTGHTLVTRRAHQAGNDGARETFEEACLVLLRRRRIWSTRSEASRRRPARSAPASVVHGSDAVPLSQGARLGWRQKSPFTSSAVWAACASRRHGRAQHQLQCERIAHRQLRASLARAAVSRRGGEEEEWQKGGAKRLTARAFIYVTQLPWAPSLR